MVCDFGVEPCLDETLQTRLAHLHHLSHVMQFYLDGSCCNPTILDGSHAAFAVVMDSALSDQERRQMAACWQPGVSIPSLQTIAVSRLPGVQCMHRAKIWAMIYICEATSSAILVSDSQMAVALGQHCLCLQDPRPLYRHAEPDLALRLWNAVQRGQFQFRKVKACL